MSRIEPIRSREQSSARSALPERQALSEHELVAGLRARDARAMAAFHERFAQPVLRILMRVLGPDPELSDLHHDVFVRALQSISELREPAALRGWVAAVAVHTARSSIERRVRGRRWLVLWREPVAPEPAPLEPGPDLEAREALRAAYAVLDRMPAAERVAFALRYFEQMELTEVASVCEVSLASIKRRLTRAEARFAKLARDTPALAGYLKEGGARWSRG